MFSFFKNPPVGLQLQVVQCRTQLPPSASQHAAAHGQAADTTLCRDLRVYWSAQEPRQAYIYPQVNHGLVPGLCVDVLSLGHWVGCRAHASAESPRQVGVAADRAILVFTSQPRQQERAVQVQSKAKDGKLLLVLVVQAQAEAQERAFSLLCEKTNNTEKQPNSLLLHPAGKKQLLQLICACKAPATACPQPC